MGGKRSWTRTSRSIKCCLLGNDRLLFSDFSCRRAEQTSSGETDKQSDRDSERGVVLPSMLEVRTPESRLAKHPCPHKTRYNWNLTYTQMIGTSDLIHVSYQHKHITMTQTTKCIHSPCEYGNNSSNCQMLKWNEGAPDSLKYWGHFLWNISPNGSRPTLPQPPTIFSQIRIEAYFSRDEMSDMIIVGQVMSKVTHSSVLRYKKYWPRFNLQGERATANKMHTETASQRPFCPPPPGSAPALRHDQHSCCHFITLARPLTWLCLVNRHDQGMIAKFITTTR